MGSNSMNLEGELIMQIFTGEYVLLHFIANFKQN